MNFQVISIHDSGPGSLRAAITEANNEEDSLIEITVNGIIKLESVLPEIRSNMQIVSRNLITIDGNGISSSIFIVGDGQKEINFKLEKIRIVGGKGYKKEDAIFNYLMGGGIYIRNLARCQLKTCHIEKNSCLSDNCLCYGGGIFNNGHLTLDSSTIQYNRCINMTIEGEASGGGLVNVGDCIILNSTINDNYNMIGHDLNTISFGNGLANAGSLIMMNTTVSQNFNICPNKDNYQLYGGGLYNVGHILLVNSTIAFNLQIGHGGGIYNHGHIKLVNTIIAENLATINPDVSGSFHSYGYNCISHLGSAHGFTTFDILDKSVHLNPLSNYGGQTLTITPKLSSPVISAGSIPFLQFFEAQTAISLSHDQRGHPRITHSNLDIGSVQI